MAKNRQSLDELREECKHLNRAVYLEEEIFSDPVTRTYGKTLVLRVMFYDLEFLPNGQLRCVAVHNDLAEFVLRAGLLTEEELYMGKTTERWGCEIPDHFFEPFGSHNGCFVAYEDGLNGEKYPYIVVADKKVDPQMVYDLAKKMGAWEIDYQNFNKEVILVQIPGYAPFQGKEEPMLFTMEGLKKALSK